MVRRRWSRTGGPATFTVSLSATSGQAVTVTYTTADGTATAGSDYTAASGTLTFAPGDTADKTITVTVLDDALDEPDEDFTVTLSALTGTPVNAIIDPATVTVTIGDDDDAPTVSISGPPTVVENGGPATFTVSLSAASGQAVTVTYTTADGTATAGSDYTAASGTLTFAPGDTADKTITVTVLDDALDEPDEDFTVTLSALTGTPVNAIIDPATVTVTIGDDDAPTVSISGPPTVVENGGPATFTVSLSAASGQAVTVTYTTADGTATAGSDYTAASGTLTFAPGDTADKTITVTILDDALDEPDKDFTVTLSALTGTPVNAIIDPATATVTITDDDAPPPESGVRHDLADNRGERVHHHSDHR